MSRAGNHWDSGSERVTAGRAAQESSSCFLSLVSFTFFICELSFELFFEIAPLRKRPGTCGAGRNCQRADLTMKTRQARAAQCVSPFELFVFRRALLADSLIARKASRQQKRDG